MFRSKCLEKTRSKRPLRAVGLVTVLMGLIACAGCTAPAQIHWSPDGTAAAYAYREQAVVIDAEGAVLSKLGKSVGGFAWSADSKTLYFAATTDQPETAITVESRWRSEATRLAGPAKTDNPPALVELSTWSNRKITPLAKFEADPVVYAALSPDEDWLAFVTGDGNEHGVYVYHLSGKRAYQLTDVGGLGLCFTGRNRLAYIEAAGNKPVADVKTAVGHVVEVTLDAKADKLARTPLLDVVVGETFWLSAVGDGLLLTAVARSVPGEPIADNELVNHIKLFQWTRANNGIVAVADSAGPLFAVSPDGKRVMIHKITPRSDKTPMKMELQVIRTNGSDGLTLRTTFEGAPMPMWPAWRGDGQITLNAPDPKPETRGGEPRQAFDVVLYDVPEKGELTGGKVLSDSWDPDLRPYEKGPATTQKD